MGAVFFSITVKWICMKNETGRKLKLGMFVCVGLLLFVIAVYYVGKRKNFFVSTITVKTIFSSVNGLNPGNNVRFSGITIGTVEEIELLNDTAVIVYMTIKKSMQPFIKTDAAAGIGSDGLMGDKVLTIFPGSAHTKPVKDQSFIAAKKAVDMEDVMSSIKQSVDNAEVITQQLALFSYKMNNGNGALSKLISDEAFSASLKNTLLNLQSSSSEFAVFTHNMNSGKGALSKLMTDDSFGKSLDSTMTNLQAGTKGLSENMEAAKKNILLRGYFKKKKKADDKKLLLLKKKHSNDSIQALKIKQTVIALPALPDSIRQ
jgi:phospholipid/cholesterol/gamma-HCH transport system substrate-binding protein